MKNFKFKVQVVIPEHYEEYTEPVYEVIDYIEHTDQEVKEINGGYLEPVYGKQIGSKEKSMFVSEKVIATYEQIPLLYNNMSFSCVKKDSNSKWFDNDDDSNYIPMQFFIEKLHKFDNYKIKYGFSYETSNSDITSSYYYKEDDRNDMAKSLGFDFIHLDWPDRMLQSDKSESNNIKK